ncbi:19509_t:CDS:1, partial [Gigaspora margarita]
PMDNCDKCDGEDSLDILKAADELELYSLIQSMQYHLINHHSSWIYKNIVKSLNTVCRYVHFQELYDYVFDV